MATGALDGHTGLAAAETRHRLHTCHRLPDVMLPNTHRHEGSDPTDGWSNTRNRCDRQDACMRSAIPGTRCPVQPDSILRVPVTNSPRSRRRLSGLRRPRSRRAAVLEPPRAPFCGPPQNRVLSCCRQPGHGAAALQIQPRGPPQQRGCRARRAPQVPRLRARLHTGQALD
jgi:hypothetical protein